MLDEILKDPKVVAGIVSATVMIADVITGAIKNSTIGRKSIVLKILARIGMSFADNLNER